MPGPQSVAQFARNILCLFIYGFVVVMTLEVLEEAKLIGKLTESASRAGAWGILVTWFVWRTQKAFPSRNVLIATSVFAFFSTCGFLLGVVEDIRWFDTIPLIGRDGAYHGVPQKVSFSIWSCCLAWMFFLLLRGVEQTQMESEKLRSELAHLTRVNTLSEFAGTLAHELNQPLTAIGNFAAAAQVRLSQNDEQTQELLREIVEQSKRAGEVIQRLRSLTQPSEESREVFVVNSLVFEIVRLMRAELQSQEVALKLKLDSREHQVLVDRILIQQVLMNLIQNSIAAMATVDPDSRVLNISSDLNAEQVRILVSDSGPGVTEEIGEKVFESFFTTKPDGMGLGLGISRTIVEGHGGALELLPDRSGFCISLPLHRDKVPEPHFAIGSKQQSESVAEENATSSQTRPAN